MKRRQFTAFASASAAALARLLAEKLRVSLDWPLPNQLRCYCRQ